MYKLEDIRTIHLEPTERCNLSCLMCDRNINGGKVNPYLKNRELTLNIIGQSITPDFLKQLDRIYMCGNYGDPIIAKDCIEIMLYFRVYNPEIKLSIVTNGCARPEGWWKSIASIVNSIRFGIDGLEDTHYIYRQNASWKKIIENAKIFINAGGYAIWDYLVFGHNEHQIDEASNLATELGFKEFIVKKTGRFFSNIKLQGKEEHCGLTKPKEKEHINQSLSKEDLIKEKYGSMDNYLDRTPIDCKAIKNKEIYISAEGIVLPCCWLAGQMYKWYLPEKSTQIWEIINKVDIENINIKYKSLQDIFNSGVFEEIQSRWNLDSCNDGKLKTCAIKCGLELDQFGDQFK